nr:peroxisome biogenesis factor 10-like isoform X3 [Arachis hypogaea]
MAAAKLVLVAPSPQPLAAQPEMMRDAEKNEQYASFVYEACRDALRHLVCRGLMGCCMHKVQGLLLLIKMRQNLFGGKCCTMFSQQVQGSRRLGRSIVTPLRCTIFIVYQTAIPYIADHISS